jgi:hypothetical protein
MMFQSIQQQSPQMAQLILSVLAMFGFQGPDIPAQMLAQLMSLQTQVLSLKGTCEYFP